MSKKNFILLKFFLKKKKKKIDEQPRFHYETACNNTS